MPHQPLSESEALRQAVDSFFRTLGQPVSAVTVAVSGGHDSTALLHALATLRGRAFSLSAAHVNHQLRGAESAEDEASLRRLCATLAIPLEVLDGSLDDRRVRTRGLEAAARELRYRRLRELRKGDHTHWIATAHQADDQAETLLLRLVTGRGPWRMAGIRPVHDGVIRPLLHVNRETVMGYLREQGLDARCDSSNESPRFLRNRIRRDVLPLLRELNPRIVSHLGQTAELEQEREALLGSVVANWSDSFERTATSASVRIDRLPPDPLIRRLLIRAEIRRIDPDERYLDAPALGRLDDIATRGGTIRPSRAIEVSSNGTSFTVRRLAGDAAPADYRITLAPGEVIDVGSHGWSVSAGADVRPVGVTESHAQEIALPAHCGPAIVVRNRRSGDRFKPLGMSEEKKLSDFFIDRKIPRDIRDTLPLVLIDGRIAWIAGVEVSDDFRLGRGESERLVLCAWRVGDDR
ncbi:MAG: tRNA lysidine(34) synthetase TilS [Acidobacteria bacterium]|nr:tRNA lysidine(34) synthetase TilS [Acidobacteriota bacterium]